MDTVTLSEAQALIQCLAHEHSLLLLSPPGVGKSACVAAAARAAGLPCRSLLGTQIAPEDVSGIPHVIGERAVFCPPRILLPESSEPFCLFLDELPAAAPDVQKAFYSLLLERRLGEHQLPAGSWVVAAGNGLEDRAQVRPLSSALINRVTILPVRVDAEEWLDWAEKVKLRGDIVSFIRFMPDALQRPVPPEPIPFSTPRSWASLAEALDQTERDGLLSAETVRSLAFGKVSASDAAIFCAMAEEAISGLLPIAEYLHQPERLPAAETGSWFVLSRVRVMAARGELKDFSPEVVNRFFLSIGQEHRLALVVDLVPEWLKLGAQPALLQTLREVTGL